jgi:uncharacterized protein
MTSTTPRELNPGEPGKLSGECPGEYPEAPRLSVVVPTRNEAGSIGKTLEALKVCAAGCCPELIVADGGSEDDTRDIARSRGALVVCAEPGRARQMNAGAGHATGDHLLFLHADTLPPPDYARHIRETLEDASVVGGAFRLLIDAPNPSLRLIERCVNLRSRWLSLPYGDQGLFMRTDTFKQLGGYADLPVMEDFDLVRRLGKRGRVALAEAAVVTSARWWLRKGVWCATMLNQACIVGYHLGVSPARLASWRGTQCGRAVIRGGSVMLDHEPVSTAGK